MTKFTVKAGNNSSNFNFTKLSSLKILPKGIEFDFYLPLSAWYDATPDTDGRISKIAGLSFGLLNHKNSSRLGALILPRENQYSFLSYHYIDGVEGYQDWRNKMFVHKFAPNEVGTVKIDQFGITLSSAKQGSQTILFGKKMPSPLFGLKQFYYFGGKNFKAPHDVECYIDFK